MSEWRADFELLQAFSRQGDQQAFATLTRRHLDLVYATALRKVTDDGAAEEICQNVFGTLARKAWQFAPDDSLPSWLHRTTLLEGKSWLRGELRRRRREQAAAELGTTMKTPDEQPAFNALVPLLDEALLSLRDKDRTALLLRYHESQSLRDVGLSLGTSEDAARKRVGAALEKLSQFFQRRGFKTATVAASAAALQHTAASASAATVSLVANAALQAAPPALVGLSALLARLVSLTKVQTAAVCFAVAAGPVAWQWNEHQQAQEEVLRSKTQLITTQAEFASLQREIERLRETSERLDVSLADAIKAATRAADTAQRFESWKQQLREQLFAADYHWPKDSPFVRIPKKILPRLQVYHRVSPPGTIKREARELLGLSPEEREQAENALHRHFATMDDLMAAARYESNKAAHINIPESVVASQVWGVPALGEAARNSAEELKSALQTVLSEDRWQLVADDLTSSGTDTLRRILNLDASEKGQEIAAWVQEQNGKLLAGYGWGQRSSSFTSGGLALELFLPGAELPAGIRPGEDDLNVRSLPETLTRPVIEWIRQQAETRLGTKGNP
ncbi:MAG TPA: sigma-70 family RNA polymerase sigma factor [Verrucomicrobiae bacterium]|nr:sigma-70 family RNA polymerase sigma factor [Verrucomicrobiae bacterium]